MRTLLLFSLLFLNTLTFAQTNLVKNGGFERNIVHWLGDAATLSPSDKKSGKYGALINQYVETESKGIDQTILVPRNTYAIEFSSWIKTESIKGGKEPNNAGIMIVEFINDAEKQISLETIAQVKGTTDWNSYKKVLKIPADAQKIKITLALSQTSGSVYFDDVKAVPLSEGQYLNLKESNPEK